MQEYDILVIGSGPSGEKAAVKAGYFGKKVALIEKESYHGGAGVNTGTLPSKALKQTAVYLSGKYENGLFGVERKFEKKTSIKHFLFHKNQIVKKQREAVKQNLLSHGVELFHGEAVFLDQNTISIGRNKILRAKNFIIATGSYPVHPDYIPFDHKTILDSDSILNIAKMPRSISILGAGIIGCEYASIFNTMGVEVNLINISSQVLSFLDQEIKESLLEEMEASGIKFFFDNKVEKIKKNLRSLSLKLSNGEKLKSEVFLFAAGRNGCCKTLGLEKLGIQVSEREMITVNEKYQTSCENIYAVGDVIGFPSLASTGMDQGRVAVSHIIETQDILNLETLLPLGIYTVPEVSSVGLSEQEASTKEEDYVTGYGYHMELPRGQLLGCQMGYLKLVVRKSDGVILGVHMIGALATEIIHYGMLLVNKKSSIRELITHVFNFPTLHDLYKRAAYDAHGKIY